MNTYFVKGDKGLEPFTKRVIKIIQSIPPGKIMTYGQVASTAGNSRGARQVVRILHSMSGKYQLPWHRVLNKKGEITIMDDESQFLQVMMLKAEGVKVDNRFRVNVEEYLFKPEIRPDT